MSLLEIIIVGIIIIGCLGYIAVYIRQPFKSKNNSCVGCPYSHICKERLK